MPRAEELLRGVATAAVKRDIMDQNRGLGARSCPASLLSMGRKEMAAGADSYS